MTFLGPPFLWEAHWLLSPWAELSCYRPPIAVCSNVDKVRNARMAGLSLAVHAWTIVLNGLSDKRTCNVINKIGFCRHKLWKHFTRPLLSPFRYFEARADESCCTSFPHFLVIYPLPYFVHYPGFLSYVCTVRPFLGPPEMKDSHRFGERLVWGELGTRSSPERSWSPGHAAQSFSPSQQGLHGFCWFSATHFTSHTWRFCEEIESATPVGQQAHHFPSLLEMQVSLHPEAFSKWRFESG